MQSTSNGGLHVNLRDNTGTEIGTTTTPIVVSGAAANGSAISGRPVRIGYSDGTTTRDALSDASGRAVVVGAGVAGTPAGGVVTIQGVSGGTAIPISATSLPLPTGAATETTLAALNTKLNSDFGVSSGAVRVAALLGNATGSADFNYGTAGAQTIRVASQIGNATGAALFGAGTTTAQVLRVVLPTDQTSIPVTQSGTWTVAASEDKNYGTVGATTLRVAAQIGNATGAADFNAGATGAQTQRTVANQGAPNTNTNAWFARLTNGTNNSQVTGTGDLNVADVINAGTGVQGALTVGTTAVAIRVGGSNLANRKLITIHNNSLVTIYWGYTNAVTTTTGTPILSGQQDGWAVGSAQDIFVIAGTASNNTRITEGA